MENRKKHTRPKQFSFAVIGSGGREDAITKALAGSPLCKRVVVMPGNYGTKRYLGARNLTIEKLTDFEAIGDKCLTSDIDMLIVGPEDPLVGGIVEYFFNHRKYRHIKVVGPTSLAARLEGSKAFAKAFMERNGIPTAEFISFTDLTLATRFIEEENGSYPIVIKADGLAAGKGVFICKTAEEACDVLFNMMNEGKFGKAGETVVIEKFLKGREVSVFAVTDGEAYQLLPAARDHKRVGEGDTGENTGGMGAISTPDLISSKLMKKIKEQIIEPTLLGMRKAGTPYAGFLYFGLMIVGDEPYVIEYNCRMGDPETQAVLPRLKTDFGKIMAAVAYGKVSELTIRQDSRCSAVVALTSRDYPGPFEKDKKITINTKAIEAMGCQILYGGVKAAGDDLVTSGGRVLYLQATASTLTEAIAICYKAATFVKYKGKYFRRDIGVVHRL